MRQKPENQKPSSEKLRISPKRSRGSGRGLHCAAPEMEMLRIKQLIVLPANSIAPDINTGLRGIARLSMIL
jgi:hypothetical protein